MSRNTSTARPSRHRPTRSEYRRSCSFEGCTKHFYAKGFCNSHYKQLQQGRPLTPLSKQGGSLPKPVVPRLYEGVRIAGKRYAEASANERRSECWIWQRSLNSNGYGQMHRNGGMVSAHRAAYEALVGPIGSDSVHHQCGEKTCVNPNHLERATLRANVGEMFARKGYEKKIKQQETVIREACHKLEEFTRLVGESAARDRLLLAQTQRIQDVLDVLRSIPDDTESAAQRARRRKRQRCRK